MVDCRTVPVAELSTAKRYCISLTGAVVDRLFMLGEAVQGHCDCHHSASGALVFRFEIKQMKVPEKLKTTVLDPREGVSGVFDVLATPSAAGCDLGPPIKHGPGDRRAERPQAVQIIVYLPGSSTSRCAFAASTAFALKGRVNVVPSYHAFH